MMDELVILTTAGVDAGKLATKRWRTSYSGGNVADNYSKASYFSVTKTPIYDLSNLDEELTRLQDAPWSFVIRGEPIEGIDMSCTRRWALEQADGSPPTFKEKPRRWLMLDIDSIDPDGFDKLDGWKGSAFLRKMLPPEFHGASCWWAFSSGAGMKDGLRMRLAFWLERPVIGDELGRWFASSPVDHAVFRTVQAIYTAAPIFEDGLIDPVPERVGFLDDGADEVCVPDLTPPPEPTFQQKKKQAQAHRIEYGPDWAVAALGEIANAIVSTPEAGMNRWGGGGRHNAVFCGALSASSLIAKKAIPQSDVEQVLKAAAKTSGLKDEREIARTIRNAFRQGGLT